MKKLILSLSAVALLAGLVLNTAWSQSGREKSADAKPHRVGLIDMAYIFKNYEKFESMREDLKGDIAQSEAKAKQMAEAVKGMQLQMKDYKEGTAEFSKHEQKIQEKTLEFESFRRNTQREILKKESEIYHTVYLEVSDCVKKYSKYYNYTLVLRFNREDLNPDDPQGLIQGMNRQVVFHQPEDDMTDSVLDHLNKRFREGGTGGTPTPAAKPDRTAKDPTKQQRN